MGTEVVPAALHHAETGHHQLKAACFAEEGVEVKDRHEEEPHPWGFMPRPLWALITRHVLAAAAAEGHRSLLCQAATLLAVSHHVAAAAYEVPLDIDLCTAPEQDLLLLPPLLTRLPLHTLRLSPRHASGAEALLRCGQVARTSGRTLCMLAATVACTDTLQRFPALSELHLHAGVLERLYPAVLHGLPALRRLGLHGYQEVQLSALPPGVAAMLHSLEVTPRPEAMRCQLDVTLPAGTSLDVLTVHGSFDRVLSSAAAPLVHIDTRALARQCSSAHIEAQQAVWLLPASCQGQEAEAALAAALLEPDAVWRRLELQLLEGTCVELPPTLAQGGGLPPRRSSLDLRRLAAAMQHIGRGSVHVTLTREQCSIFHPWVLVMERAAEAGSIGGGGRDAGGGGSGTGGNSS